MTINLTLFISVLVIFLGILGYLAWLGYKRTTSAKDYLLAGGSVNPYMMALSYGAAFISTAAIVGFGGLSGQFGFQMIWVVFANIFVGILIAYLVFGKRMRQMGHNLNAQTFSDFLGKRYGSRFAQWFSGIVIFLFMPLYAAAVMRGAAEFMQPIFGIDLFWLSLIYIVIVAIYVITGGLKGVTYSDSFLGSIMLVSMIILVVFVYSKLGGITTAHSQLTSMAHLVPEGMVKAGHTGWTSFSVFNSKFWWLTVSTLTMGIGIGVLAQPQLLVRFMTVKRNRDLNRALLIGGIFILIVVGGAFATGALSNVSFHADQGLLSIQVAQGNADQVIPQFITTYMPQIFVYIFLLTLISAGISTSSAQFHTIGTSIGKDVYEDNIAKIGNLKNIHLWKRIGIASTIFIISILSVFIFPNSIVSYFFAMISTILLVPIIGFLFWKTVTKFSVIWSIIVGLASAITWTFLINGGTQSIVSRYSIHLISSIHPGIIGAVFSLITLLITSMFIHRVPKANNIVNVKRTDNFLLWKRVGIAVAIIFTFILGVFILPKGIVAKGTAFFFAIAAGTFLAPTIGALFWRGATKAGAIWSMVVGLGVSIIWTLVFNGGTLGIKSLFSIHPISSIEPGIVGLAFSIVILFVVSAFTRKISKDHVDLCFAKEALAED